MKVTGKSDARHYPYRVFVSYPHEQSVERIRDRVVEFLEKRLEVRPICDSNIAAGSAFSDQIREMIATAHVFMPIITGKSAKRPWVNQEIGYAMGLGVPMLPIAVDKLPEGMAESTQAIRLDKDGDNLANHLSYEDLHLLVQASRRSMRASHFTMEGLYRRTDLMVEKAESLLLRGIYGRVRQRIAFSSFSIPDRGPRHPDFAIRDGKYPRDIDLRERLRSERQVMEAHAREKGCDLILDPYVGVPAAGEHGNTGQTLAMRHGPEGVRLRMSLLRDFLLAMPPEKIRIALCRGVVDSSLIMVGDWFAVEAVVPHYRGGYRYSTLTEHAPTVLRKVEEFDDELHHLLRDQEIKPEKSRDRAVEEIEKILKQIK